MRIVPGNAQHIGTRIEQQDDFGFSRLKNKRFVPHGGIMATLADGMGGMAKGGEAGRLAKDTMLQAYQAKAPNESILQALQRSLAHANQAVVALAQQVGLEGDIGTTLVAAVINGQHLYWVSVGDSRIYLFRRGRLTQLTEDHDYARELEGQVKAGKINPSAAQSHPERRALTSYLGQAHLFRVDRNLRPFHLEPGDRILLCSDGLYGALSEAEMAESMAGPPQEAAEALVARVLAKNKSKQDNVTVAIMACEPDTRRLRRPLAKFLLGTLVAGLLGLGGGTYLVKQHPNPTGPQASSQPWPPLALSPATGGMVRPPPVTPGTKASEVATPQAAPPALPVMYGPPKGQWQEGQGVKPKRIRPNPAVTAKELSCAIPSSAKPWNTPSSPVTKRASPEQGLPAPAPNLEASAVSQERQRSPWVASGQGLRPEVASLNQLPEVI